MRAPLCDCYRKRLAIDSGHEDVSLIEKHFVLLCTNNAATAYI